ncbi:MAG: helix-turn-helix domain-containing protein [Gemmobacter sp.]
MLLATAVAADVPERKRVVSERRRQQLFRDHVGLTPATTARLHRWHCLLRRLRTTPRPGWAALAVSHGWFDQSHMARDFRTFSGLSPTEYFRSMISPLSNTEGHIVR